MTMVKTVARVWDCPACGIAKITEDEVTCIGCGAPRPDDAVYVGLLTGWELGNGLDLSLLPNRRFDIIERFQSIRRIEFPLFEAEEIASVPMDRISERRFDLIERSMDLANAQRIADAEDERVFQILDERFTEPSVVVTPADSAYGIDTTAVPTEVILDDGRSVQLRTFPGGS